MLFLALLFFPFLGSAPLFDWDEINFAECAREMLVSGKYLSAQINYQTFYEKPPLFIWMQAASMKMFGIGEFAARFPNAVVGIVSLFYLLWLSKRMKNISFGIIWMALYLSALLPHMYFKSGIIDPWFNFFMFVSISEFVWAMQNEKLNSFSVLLSSLMCALAVLTKGPVALIIVPSTLFFTFVWLKKLPKVSFLLLWIISLLVFSSLWFAVEYVFYGAGFIHEFITYQIRLFSTEDAGHGGPFYYHPLILLIGCFPASLFFINYFFQQSRKESTAYDKSMQVLFFLVLILFSIVKTKILHYSSLCYFPLTYLAAVNVYALLTNRGGNVLNKAFKLAFIFISLLLTFALALIPFVGNHIEVIGRFTSDANVLLSIQNPISWSKWYYFGSVFFVLLILVSLYFLLANRLKPFLFMYFCSAILLIQYNLNWVMPNIHYYSQEPMTTFMRETLRNDSNAVFEAWGFKSYAQYFYGQRKMQDGAKNTEELMQDVGDSLYFITKQDKDEWLEKQPNIHFVTQKGLFKFYKLQ